MAAWQFVWLGWFVPRGWERCWPNAISRRCDELWDDEDLSFVERLGQLAAFVRGECERGDLEDWFARRCPTPSESVGMPEPPVRRLRVRAWSPDEAPSTLLPVTWPGIQGDRAHAHD